MRWIELEVERLWDLVEGVSKYDALLNKFLFTPQWIAGGQVVVDNNDDVWWIVDFNDNVSGKTAPKIWHRKGIYEFVRRKLDENNVHIAELIVDDGAT
jgi:hypothetical protein